MTSPHKWLLFTGALLGFISVALGAFGAHALKQKLSPDMLSIFEVGARYQMYHALAMCMIAWGASNISNTWLPFSGWLFFVGTLIFSGSLYLLAFTGIRLFGAFTPIGGVILLAGWASLAIAALKNF
jgi:uncharacterized membrane protein YgdD (TMEM256/DUF423 family)